MSARKRTDYIVVHHAASTIKMAAGVKEIRQWHLARGMTDIGYAGVIRRSGKFEPGRAMGAVGAHAKGYNSRSVGFCLEGGLAADGKTPENNYTAAQMAELERVVRNAKALYPAAEVVGHRDLDPTGKPFCPMFDVKAWWKKCEEAYYADQGEDDDDAG